MANMTSDGFYIAKSGRKYRNPPGRPLREGPTDPALIRKIVRLRDKHNMDWRTIGETLNLSHQAPFLLYKRWKLWATLQKNQEVRDGAA